MGRSKRLREHANPRSGSRQAALDARAADNGFSQGFGVLQPNRLLREIDQKFLKRRRVRHRRLHVYSTDPKRPQGDLWATIDRIPPTWQDRPYRELKKKDFSPQMSPYWSLWTSS